jgi:hypothetical protein
MQWIQHHHYLLVANGTEQNFMEVERDFSDLETKIEYLLANPEDAKRIADNNVKTFRERYFAPAAEACYWRALIHGWAASSFQPQVFKSTPGEGLGRPRGMRFENFAYVLPVSIFLPSILFSNVNVGFLKPTTRSNSSGIVMTSAAEGSHTCRALTQPSVAAYRQQRRKLNWLWLPLLVIHEEYSQQGGCKTAQEVARDEGWELNGIREFISRSV